MENKTLLNVDIRKEIDNLTESIEKYTEHQNKLWQGVLRLIITLSSSLLIVTIALVEKIFNSTIHGYLIFSWILFFNSIVFGIIAEINEVIFFSNMSLDMSKKIQEYAKLLSSGTEVPYQPEDDACLMTYNDIKWGVITIDSFIFAVLFMCAALLEKVTPRVCPIIIIVGAISIAIVNIYLIRKRKTGN